MTIPLNYIPGGFTELGPQAGPNLIGVETGMVWCPIKQSHIAILRCGELQDAHHCGNGCQFKASEEDIQRARHVMKAAVDNPAKGLTKSRHRKKR